MKRSIGGHLTQMAGIAALSAAGVAAAAGRPSAPELRQMLDEILASGYQLKAPLQVRLQEWLMRGLRWLSERLGSLSEAGPLADLPLWMNWVIFGVCMVLLGLLLAHMALTLRGVLAEGRTGDGERRERAQTTNPRSLMDAAEEAFRRGEHDAAVRLLYRAVLLRLDRLGLLNHDPARTNWENVLALHSSADELRDAMTGLARVMDDCVYGGGRASAQTWERARDWADILWRVEAAP